MRKLAFQTGNSIIHRLYPLSKLIWLFIFSGLLFLTSNSLILGGTAIMMTVIVRWVDDRIFFIRGIRLVFSTAAALFLMYILFDKSGQMILATGLPALSVSSGGLNSAILFSGRFLSVVLLSYLFVLTTEAGDLAYALMKSGLPYRWGFMFVTALRLAPILEEEGRTIFKAQVARGMRFDQNSLKNTLFKFRQFMTPLLFIALRKADKLFFSMEGRGFGKYTQRTFFREVNPSYLDGLAMAALIGLIISFYFIQLRNLY